MTISDAPPPVEDDEEDLARTFSSAVPIAPLSERADRESLTPEPEPVESAMKSRRQKQIDAWNRMADEMLAVVKTIRKNERSQRQTRRALAFFVLAMVLGVSFATWRLEQAIHASTEATVAISTMKAEMRAKQDATLSAVNALTEAMSKTIEAQSSLDPEAEAEAHKAALNAQKKALEAEKVSAPAPMKADYDRKIKAVAKRVEKLKPRREKKKPEPKVVD